LDELAQYSPNVREHVAHPRNMGEISNATGSGTEENPVCGDVMTVWIRVGDGIIRAAGLTVKGCLPSIAAGSVATESIIGRSVAEVDGLSPDDIDQALGGLPKVKRHCAFLAARAVRKAVADYRLRREI
jgi:nitrogen fixation NifU-like protein